MDACGPYCYKGIQGIANSTCVVPPRCKLSHLLWLQAFRFAAIIHILLYFVTIRTFSTRLLCCWRPVWSCRVLFMVTRVSITI
jgi:hypothetical protein